MAIKKNKKKEVKKQSNKEELDDISNLKIKYNSLDPKKLKPPEGVKLSDFYTRRDHEFMTHIPWWKIWRPLALWNQRLRNNTPERTQLVQMELISGDFITREFLEKEEGFTFLGGTYMFEPKHKRFMASSRQWVYFFHQRIAVPINRDIPSEQILTAIEESDVTGIKYAINPRTLKRFILSKVAQWVMQGQAIDKLLRQVFMLLIANLLITGISALILFWKLGLFKSVVVTAVP